MKELLLWMILAQGADASTTIIGLQRGCVEGVPVWRNAPYAGLAVKGGSTVVLSFTLPRLKQEGHPKLAKWIAGSLAGAGTLATIHNLRQLPRC